MPSRWNVEVGDDEVTDSAPPSSLGTSWAYRSRNGFNWPSTSASVIVLTGRLTVRRLVLGQGEIGTDLDLHLEPHRPVVGQFDGRDVELGLDDRVELVVLVDLLQARPSARST